KVGQLLDMSISIRPSQPPSEPVSVSAPSFSSSSSTDSKNHRKTGTDLTSPALSPVPAAMGSPGTDSNSNTPELPDFHTSKQPFISFPWLFHELLSRIALGEFREGVMKGPGRKWY